MNPDLGTGTLRPSKPLGATLGLTFLLFLVFITLGEVLCRSEVVRLTLTSPSLGSRHRGLEEQWSRLEYFAAGRQTVDCLFLGDSTVQTDFAPLVFDAAYREKTGEAIECFNFGIGASNVASSAALAATLIGDYQPRLFIFGIHALNFTTPAEVGGANYLLETPWLRYKLGHLSAEGWLYEHSYLYRYMPIFGRLVRFQTNLRGVSRGVADELPARYYPMEGQGPFDMQKPPDPQSDLAYDVHYFAELGNFELISANLEALDEISDLQSANTLVIAVEMPVSESYFYYFKDGEQEYRAFLNEIGDRLSAESLDFWETTAQIALPDTVWFNRNHLNKDGAELFSRWLGQQLGEAVKQGKITLTPR